MNIKDNECQLLIKSFLKSYRITHTEDETIELVKSILIGEKNIIPIELESIGKDRLSSNLGAIILESIRNSISNKEEVINLIPIIIENNIRINSKKNQKKLKINNRLLERISICTMALMLSLGNFNCSNKKENLISEETSKSITIDNLELNIEKINEIIQINGEDNKIALTKTTEQTTQINKVNKNQNQEIDKANKETVLYNFKKYKTIDEILKRQKELESLNLKDKDKLYKKCSLSAPIQWFIYEQATVNGFPADLIFSTIYTESRGNYNSSGEESYNKCNDSYDLGLTQQNTKSSLISFCKYYNVDYSDNNEYKKVYKLMRDNDYINVIGCLLEYKEIESRFDSYNPEEFAGCYNGWLLWKNKKTSVEYVDIFLDAYYNTFTSYHTVTSKKEAENKLKDGIKKLKKLNSSQTK